MFDVIDIVTKIRNQGVSVFLIGSAVLMLIVTLSAFQWLKETVDAKKNLKKQRDRERRYRSRRLENIRFELATNPTSERRKKLLDQQLRIMTAKKIPK